MRVSKLFITSPWSGQCLSGWQQLSLGKEYSGEVHYNAPWCMSYPIWRSRAACCSRISTAGPARLKKGLDCRWAADAALSLHLEDKSRWKPAPWTGRMFWLLISCPADVMEGLCTSMARPWNSSSAPGAGSCPQEQSWHYWTALFLFPAYELYPDISWGVDKLYMQLLSEFHYSILKSNIVYICC